MSTISVISIGSDRKIFDEGSAVRERAREYGKLFKELHVVVFSLRKYGFTEQKIADNVWIYPTDSLSKLLYITDALLLGTRIVSTRKIAEKSAVITTQDPFESGLSGALLKRRLGLPLHVQIHTDFLSPEFIRGSFLNRVRRTLALAVLKAGDAFRVVSDRMQSELCARYSIDRSRVTVLPIFVDIEKMQRAAPFGEFRARSLGFGTVGIMASRLTKEKDIQLALDAFAAAALDVPDVALVIIGDGPEEKALKAHANGLGIAGRVFFEGWKGDLQGFYKAADFFLLTSKYEGYGMTLVEAAAAGLPIITTNVGIAEKITGGGSCSFVCPVGDKGCIARSIGKLASDPALRADFSSRVTEHARLLVGTKEGYLASYKHSLESALYAYVRTDKPF